MLDVRLLVVSCPRRKPIQQIWTACREANWPDCPFPITVLSPDPDIGWNANLIKCLEGISEPLILQLLDDNLIEPSKPGEWTENMLTVAQLMTQHSDIGMVKLQAGGAHAPEIPFPEWPRLREYDRQHHPFKRTNLIPTMYRREWLLRLSRAVLRTARNDAGRKGALEFEVTGTLLTKDAVAFPERMLGIHRPDADGGGGDSLLVCFANDAVVEGRMRPLENLRDMCIGVPGIEAFL